MMRLSALSGLFIQVVKKWLFPLDVSAPSTWNNTDVSVSQLLKRLSITTQVG